MPLCENGCGNQAIRFTKKGKPVCSDRPAGCPTVLKKMQDTSIEKYGVPNASSTVEVKEKRRQKSLEKYGVDNVSKASEVKDNLSEIRSQYWKTFTEKLISRSKVSSLSMSKKQYYKTVWKITNFMYNKYINQIDSERKRGNSWHVDHKVSIFHGYHAGIPPHIIGDINNLELIPGIINETKRHENSSTVQELYDKFNEFYQINELPNYDKEFFKPNNRCKPSNYTDELGKCDYCGSDAHYKYESGKWCCSSHRNRCPSIREKNSTMQKLSPIKKQSTEMRKRKF